MSKLRSAALPQPGKASTSLSLARRDSVLDRKSLHQALADYAIQHAGTDDDLDSDLEAAATDRLLQQN